MSSSLSLSLLVGVLVGCGVTLLMARGIVRSLLGVILMSNGINIIFLIAAGAPGRAPIVGLAPEEQMADPIPQALTLTAIVITLALTGFVLALAHRSWQLSRTDLIENDDEDTRIGLQAIENDMSHSDFHGGIDNEPLDPGDDPDPGGSHYCTPPTVDGASRESGGEEVAARRTNR